MRSRAHRRLLAGFAAAFTLSVAVPASAQSAAGTIDVGAADLAEFPKVSVSVSVPPEVTPTVASNVSVVELGEKREVQVEVLPSDDLRVVLAIDTSGSMTGAPLDAAKDAATQFLTKVPDRTPIAVVGFGDKASVQSGFTTDKIDSRQAIAGLRPRGETTLFDAVVIASQLFPAESNARRVIIVLTDGADTRSSNNLHAAVEAIGISKEVVHSVALKTRDTDYASLQALSSASAGMVANAEDPRALGETFSRVTAALVNRYRLSWRSAANGPTRTTIRFDIPGASPLQRDVEITYPALPPVAAPVGAAPSAPVVPAAVTVPTAAVADSMVSGSTLLLIGLAAVFVALVVLGHTMMLPRVQIRRLSRELGVDTTAQLSAVSRRAVTAMDRAITRSNHRLHLESLLQQAGMNIAPAEAASIVLAIAGVAFIGGLMTRGLVWALLSIAVVVGVAAMWLKLRIDRRARRFANQLDGTLQLMVSSLRTGFGVAQAVDAVASDAPSPTGEEFRRAARETRIGRELPSALRDVAFRTKSEDFGWVVDAIEINREVGGSLAEVLENASITLRDRSRLTRQVRALSAEGRLSGVVLVALPLLLLVFLQTSNPDYINPLFHSGTGQKLLLVGVGLLVAGGLWLRRIVQVKF
jgi:tight adherence protein B